jgi:hypothetical protein
MYYASFMPVPDNYALYMLLGGSFLLLAPRKQKWIPVALGVLAGLMTLARSDGLLWLGLAGLTVMWRSTNKEDGTKNTFKDWFISIIPAGLLVVFGYLITMGFWHYRNIPLFNSFMTPGGGRLLWLQNYNETFIYPAESLTREGFLKASSFLPECFLCQAESLTREGFSLAGWDLALQNRINAFSSNLSNTFAAQGEIFLFPFMLIGLWQLRKDLRTKIAVTGWLILFAVMTVIFPFAGSRGSFFHAGAAFQPFWWVAAPIGLDAVISWLRRRGQFTDRNAPYVFQGILVLLAIFMTAYLVNIRVLSGWAKDDAIYASVEKLFQDNGISPMDVVIVRNPPGYYINSGRPAISLPFGDESTILQVAERYQADYLVLEKGGTFESIQDLYDDPQSNPSFFYLGEVDDAKLYRIELAR